MARRSKGDLEVGGEVCREQFWGTGKCKGVGGAGTCSTRNLAEDRTFLWPVVYGAGREPRMPLNGGPSGLARKRRRAAHCRELNLQICSGFPVTGILASVMQNPVRVFCPEKYSA